MNDSDGQSSSKAQGTNSTTNGVVEKIVFDQDHKVAISSFSSSIIWIQKQQKGADLRHNFNSYHTYLVEGALHTWCYSGRIAWASLVQAAVAMRTLPSSEESVPVPQILCSL